MKRPKNIFRVSCPVSRIPCLGQSLVEVMVAVVILAMIATALVFGTTVAIRNARFSEDQARATKYAQEGMELIRSFRDQSDWDTFEGDCATHDISFSDPVFVRTLVECIEDPIDSDRMRATVRVSWQSGSLTHQSELTSYFTKWE